MRNAVANAPASLSLNSNLPSTPRPRAIIVAGPTGVGKSSFAVLLAERIGGEIIGADAFQIYAGLPLLTAQPAADLLARISHHLIGVLSLAETCDAARYLKAARSCINDVLARGHIPIIVGGTGLYIKALTHGLADLPPLDPELRRKIATMSLSETITHLREADTQALEQIDARNPVRVRRALEIVLSTGQPLAKHRSTWSQPTQEFHGITLEREREDLHQRIAENVNLIFAAGAIEEVRAAGKVGPGAARAIGFREIQALLKGELEELACRDAIITATRRYAKRQLTWCRNQFNFPHINLTATTSSDSIEAALRLTGGNTAHSRR